MDRIKAGTKSSPLIRRLEKKLKKAKLEDDGYMLDGLRDELGTAYLDIGEAEKALDLFRELSEDTHGEAKYQGIFRAYIDSGRFDEAKKLVPYIISNFPGSHRLLNSLGLYYYRTGDSYEALRYYDKARCEAEAPDAIITILSNKAIALNKVRYFREALWLLKILVKVADDDSCLLELAYCYSEKGEPQKAIKIYEGLIAKGALSANVYGGLYCALGKLGRFSDAFAVASAGVKKFSREHPGLYENLAEAFQHAGLSERNPAALKKALAVVNKGLEIFPDEDRLRDVRASIEADADFLEEDLRMDAWRKGFHESSLTDDKRPVLVLFPSCAPVEDKHAELAYAHLDRSKWFQNCSSCDFDTENYVVIYRDNLGMSLDDYLGTADKFKRGAKVIFLFLDERKKIQLSAKTLELCKARPFTILQCDVSLNVKKTKVAGVKWTNLVPEEDGKAPVARP